MVAPQIAEGRLVQLADHCLLQDFAYFLVYPEGSHKRPKVAAFCTWVLGAAAAPDARGALVSPR